MLCKSLKTESVLSWGFGRHRNIGTVAKMLDEATHAMVDSVVREVVNDVHLEAKRSGIDIR